MIDLNIHNVEKIQAKRRVFKTFIVIDFVLIQDDGSKVKVQAFSNREGVEVEWEPEEVTHPFEAYDE